MQNTSTISNGDLVFYRRLRRNLVFSEVLAYFASVASREGLTKRQLGKRIGKDAAQITRWFSEPSNLCLDTVSDLLTGMGAEMDFRVTPAGEQHSADALMREFDEWSAESVLEISQSGKSATQTTAASASVSFSGLKGGNSEQQATG